MGELDILILAGQLVFIGILVGAAVQYRRRVKQVKSLTSVNQSLARELAAAQARIAEMERWLRRPSN